jgi:hypothetical protein
MDFGTEFAMLRRDMPSADDMATVLVRFGRSPIAKTLYAGVCLASPEEIASLLGVSEATARKALKRPRRFIPVPSHEHDDPEPMYIAVITCK